MDKHKYPVTATIYHGKVHNGRIALDDDPIIPEGSRVLVTIIEEDNDEEVMQRHMRRRTPLLGSIQERPLLTSGEEPAAN